MLTRLQPSRTANSLAIATAQACNSRRSPASPRMLHGEAHALHAGFVIFGLKPAEQGLEPAGAPAKPLHRRLQVGGRTRGNLDDDDGAKPAIDLDRMGHASALGLPGAMGRIVHDALPLLQRRPGRGSEMGYVSTAVRPGRRHGISPSGFVNQQHAGDRPGNKTALDREPGSEKAARRRRRGKISPKRSVLGGLYLLPACLASSRPPGSVVPCQIMLPAHRVCRSSSEVAVRPCFVPLRRTAATAQFVKTLLPKRSPDLPP